MKKTAPAILTTSKMHILSNCEDIDFIEDLLPADENLEQLVVTL